MHSVTLLTSPERHRLDPALVDSLRNAWGGGDAVWLAPDEAATFDMKRMPGNRWDVWAECQGMGVDLVIVPCRRAAQEDAAGGYGQHHDPAGMH